MKSKQYYVKLAITNLLHLMEPKLVDIIVVVASNRVKLFILE